MNLGDVLFDIPLRSDDRVDAVLLIGEILLESFHVLCYHRHAFMRGLLHSKVIHACGEQRHVSPLGGLPILP